MITIAKYEQSLSAELWDVFFTSIHFVCQKHYSQEQINAWAPKNFDQSVFKSKMDQIRPFVAVYDGRIVGYADLQPDGLIDHFFIHGEFQGKGIGSALMTHILLQGFQKPELYSHVSNTAKPFFQRHGFQVVEIQYPEIRGVVLQNNLMRRFAS